MQFPHLAWIDLETTGLEPTQGSILEVALIITDNQLRVTYANSWCVEFYGDLEDEYVNDMHTQNGLLEDCRYSKHQLDDIEARMIAILSRCDERLRIAGSSPHFDRSWIKVHMPQLNAMLHHQHLDVSTLRIFFGATRKPLDSLDETTHRALADLYRDVSLLRQFTRST